MSSISPQCSPAVSLQFPESLQSEKPSKKKWLKWDVVLLAAVETAVVWGIAKAALLNLPFLAISIGGLGIGYLVVYALAQKAWHKIEVKNKALEEKVQVLTADLKRAEAVGNSDVQDLAHQIKDFEDQITGLKAQVKAEKTLDQLERKIKRET